MKHWRIYLYLTATVFAAACLPDRDNPWDEGAIVDPEEVKPVNLNVLPNAAGKTVLAWGYSGTEPEGFKIDRKINNGEWTLEYANINPDNRSYVDETANFDHDHAYSYRVYSYFGRFNSSRPEASIARPSLVTNPATEVSESAVSTGGTIGEANGFTIQSRGIVWSTGKNPVLLNIKSIKDGSDASDTLRIENRSGQIIATQNDSIQDPPQIAQKSASSGYTVNGSGAGSFTSQITGLLPVTTYYIRAYAVLQWGVLYGNELSFETGASPPTVVTTAVSQITTHSAIVSGEVTGTGGAPVTARGIAFGTSPNPSIQDNIINAGSGTGVFTSNITGLNPGTQYYVRAFATNSGGTTYGSQQVFTTNTALPTVTTSQVSALTHNSATAAGNVTSTGGLNISARGIAYSTSTNPTLSSSTLSAGSGTGNFSVNLSGLNPNTTYYLRAYATNSLGTAYGNQVIFTTEPTPVAPEVSTNSIGSVTYNSAIVYGDVTSSGTSTVTSRGVAYATSTQPTVSNHTATSGSGTGSFTSNLTNLTPNTTYYVRAFATSNAGTSYGNQLSFKTDDALVDIDGNAYQTVTIGTQVWMVENLKTTRYNDGTAINLITDGVMWKNMTTGAYCYYGNNSANGNTYGVLYNIIAIQDSRLCPAGWKVPADTDFGKLEMFLGMTETSSLNTGWRGTIEGSMLKNNSGWTGGNGSNSTGFKAMPGGYRTGFSGTFEGLGTIGIWWARTGSGSASRYGRRLDGNNTKINRDLYDKYYGLSVRCLKE
jgi:uncharacterized protein (TIGR02145 family)